MSGTQGNFASFEDTVKDFWATRPNRPKQGRLVAGVAAGLGRRYGIDPVIVRVVLVVSAFYGGAGLLLYLLGWLFLPAEDDQTSAFGGMVGRGRSSTPTGLAVLLCLALIPASGFTLGGHISQLVGLAMLAAALYLLHRSRGEQYRPTPTYSQSGTGMGAGMEGGAMGTGMGSGFPGAGSGGDAATGAAGTTAFGADAAAGGTGVGAPTSAASAAAGTGAGAGMTATVYPGTPSADGPTDTVPSAGEGVGSVGGDGPTARFGTGPVPGEQETQRVGPPSWDPLGAAPFAWDLPEPNAGMAPQPTVALPVRRRSRRGALATLGAVLVAVAVLVALAPSTPWITPVHALGVVTAVLGLGLVRGAFIRSGRWLMVPAVILASIGVVATASGLPTTIEGGGQADYQPTSLAQLQSDYTHSVGQLRLDLTQLPTNTGGSATVHVEEGIGHLEIDVPPGAVVTATCQDGAGHINCLGSFASGVGQTATGHSGDTAGNDPNVLHLTIDASVGSGQLEVTNG